MRCRKSEAKFKVQVPNLVTIFVEVNTGRKRYVYFNTLESARKFCNEVFAATGRVLSVEKA